MAGLIDVILSRRSIRKFTRDPVTDQQIETLLRCGFAAPSAGNTQPWQFIVIRDREILDSIPTVHEHADMVKHAPAAILVCAEPTVAMADGYWQQDFAAAAENILLAAHAMGLGAVWLGVYPRENRMAGLRTLTKLPERIIPGALIAIGCPAEAKPPSNRYDETKIHYDRF